LSLPTPAAPRSRGNTLINLALASLGGVLLWVTVQRVGWYEVQASLARIGWWFVPVFALGGIRFTTRAAAWRVCAGVNLGLRRAFAATIAGDALGNLTPLGLFASEPAKVYLVKEQLPLVTAVSSVAAENVFYILSVLLMIGAGALAFFSVADLSPALRFAAQGVVASVMVGSVLGFWIARGRPAILSRLARLITAITGRGATAEDRLKEIETHFYAALTWPKARLARVLAWEGLFHVAAVAEVLLVLRLLPGSANATLVDAFVLETAGRLIVVAFKFIPYRLGVDEAGTALVAQALALDPTVGVALALVRRLRILTWNAMGLVVLARSP